MKTLAALLEELKEVDAKAYNDISHLEFIGWHQPRNQAMDHLQGCIQRACERREWYTGQFSMSHPGPYSADITDANNVDNQWFGVGDSPAEALLAAYIAAVRGEAKR